MGTVHVDGQDILKMRDNELSDFRRQKLGFIFQEFNLIDTMSVRDNILLPLFVDRLSIRNMEDRLTRVANILRITKVLSS